MMKRLKMFDFWLPTFILAIGEIIAPQYISVSGSLTYLWIILIHAAILIAAHFTVMFTTILIPYPDYFAKFYGGTKMICSWKVGIWNTKFGIALGKYILMAEVAASFVIVFPIINLLPGVNIEGVVTHMLLFAGYALVRILMAKE